jgi:NAD(P)-dependent dehydrogenase (short-subunit alcohol dehydrogenase family)
VLEQAGHIDVLVNNAGVMWAGITEAYTVEQARQVLEVNFLGACRTDRAVLPSMRRQGSGLLIHMSSLAGGLVFPFATLYCASKMALEVLAEAYRYELSGAGIDSIILEPGPFRTNLPDSQVHPQDQARVEAYGALAQLPIQKLNGVQEALQDPQMVADLVADLIAQPMGSRPLRSIAGAIDFGLAPLNKAKEEAQHTLFEAWGLTQLLPGSASQSR